MLSYTGHPLADVGVATVCAFRRKTDPRELSRDDLVRTAEYLEREYYSGKLLSYLTCVFPNSAYVNPTIGEEKKENYKREVLYGFENKPDAAATRLRCVFCREPAARIAYRQHVPMITGEKVLNFFPAGLGGMAICGGCLLAVQAFPLGARRCHGRALAVHCPDDHSLTYAFAHRFLNDNQRLLLLAQKSGEKYEDAKAPRTLVLDALIEIARERKSSSAQDLLPSVTVYHLTNSGQGPDIDIFELPSEVVSFVAAVCRAGTADVWNSIVARAWERPVTAKLSDGKRGRRNRQNDENPLPPEPQAGKNRNFLYEDLFGLPQNAASFIRTYFLRRAWKSARQAKNDPRSEYSHTREIELVSWPLTHHFLKEILGMDKPRIEAVRRLADCIAEHIQSSNDARLFQKLYMVRHYNGLRALLLRASLERVASGKEPLVGLDEFYLIFEEGEEIPRIDWRLARDLVLIRLIEQLKGFFTKERAALEAVTEPEETDETSDE